MRIAVSFVAALLFAAPAWSQSLKPETPAPLKAGINTGTVDNFVGTHYWYFMGGPGKVHVHAQFKPMGLLGNNFKSSITVSLSDEKHTWSTPKVLSSDSKIVDGSFDGDLKAPTKVIVTVAPPTGGLVRMGGDYQLEVTGAATFGPQSSADPVVGMYKEMNGYTNDLGDCKFIADGTVESTSGTNGKWKLFDKDSQTYVVDIEGQQRHSLQFHAGRGLCDGDIIFFQLLR
ncbi:MAG TPA: hypothetical protein V6C81_29245 [Planktothrix sp.]